MSAPEENPQDDDKIEEQKPVFILEQKQKKQSFLWLWALVLLGVIALLLLGGTGIFQQLETEHDLGPFFQVTNREMSLFLWQNPEYMRINNRYEKGYLPGFYAARKVTPKVEAADKSVVVPSNVIFLYHSWKRLLSGYMMPRPIPMPEFVKFLDYAEEWLPKNWPECPQEYKQWVEGMQTLEGDSLHAFQIENLQSLSQKELPDAVRKAFFGWKNYFREGDLIDELEITIAEMREFLKKYPNYSRSYWRNIYPNYLKSFQQKDIDSSSKIPGQELVPFLKIAFLNYQQSL